MVVGASTAGIEYMLVMKGQGVVLVDSLLIIDIEESFDSIIVGL